MAILIVDDTPVNLMLLEEMLRQEGYADVYCVRSGQDALEMLATTEGDAAAEKRIDLILMDVMMPGMDGIETCQRIKAQEGLRDIPVIMVTVRDDDEALAQAFDMGATDYIIKPVKEIELLARVRAALKLKRETDRRKAREHELVELTLQLDVKNRRLMHMVPRDSLTEVGNRRYFDEILSREWNRARREGVPLSLLMVDLDDFKKFNETHGRDKGDECLRKVADVLSCVLKRAGDTVVRFDGDEFAAIMPNTPNGGALSVAHEFQEQMAALDNSFSGVQTGEALTASIGLATAEPCRGSDMQSLITAADGARYLAKAEGGNRIKVALDCR
ncbi:MAG: diguanylate cyclase [Desulfobulbaceae bacterium]|nr:diguanylate cyclase [Desulfobulbaceae bacterium]HIJ91693.1 diguanylate cyclase [Deltaproteobacteria bacterium]